MKLVNHSEDFVEKNCLHQNTYTKITIDIQYIKRNTCEIMWSLAQVQMIKYNPLFDYYYNNQRTKSVHTIVC